jgi:translation initiation factor 1
MPEEDSELVFSTDRPIPRKNKSQRVSRPEYDKVQKVIVRLDRKGRGGKSVTVIDGLHMQKEKMDALLKQLKSKLGTGGTLKDASLEIQGDHCSAIMKIMEKMGCRPRRAGG